MVGIFSTITRGLNSMGERSFCYSIEIGSLNSVADHQNTFRLFAALISDSIQELHTFPPNLLP